MRELGYFRQRFIDSINDEGNIQIRGFEWPPVDVFKAMSPNDFDSYFVEWVLQTTFGKSKKLVKGPVQLLPQVFNAGCITTNFDYILENVYREGGIPFEAIFAGTGLNDAPRRLAEDAHCLLRIHGEADSNQGRVLTSEEYSEYYGNEGYYKELLQKLIASRSLLFLGCSLSIDRTFQTLREIRQSAVVETPRHYAFLPLYEDTNREARRRTLGEADVHPIWYPGDEQDQAIEDLLVTLLEGGLHD